MSEEEVKRPLFRGLLARRRVVVKSGRMAISRARVTKADGTKGDIEYSVPRVAWFNLLGFVWRYKALIRYLKEDWQWRQK